MKYKQATFKITLYYDVYVGYDTQTQLETCLDSLNEDDIEIEGYEQEWRGDIEIESIKLIEDKIPLRFIDATEYSEGTSE